MVLLLSDERKFKFKICAVAAFLARVVCTMRGRGLGACMVQYPLFWHVQSCAVYSQSKASPGPLVQ